MLLSILILPLLGALTSGFFGRKLGVKGSHLITCSCVIFSAILASVAFYEIGLAGSPVYVHLCNWIESDYLSIDWEFQFDQLTVTMFIPVLYISALIHIFSTDYMSEDPHNQRFFSYLSLFTFFMLVLVAGANYFVMFVGWEGIGIVSYLLINFWFTRLQANKSAILALTMNRVGDMGLSIGFFAILALFGSLDYSVIYTTVPFMNETAITIIGLLLLIGAMAKSANIPLHSWLPGSMEGPTPVSALIHAATLVTAGLYLLVRSSPLLEYSSTALLVITLVGASTAFFAATCGLVQNDLKRIIAFSTISQLGYMVMAVGISQYNVALMHVVNHAFFKALLFLGAGAVIHSFSDQQDIRKLGGLIKFLPFTYTAMLVGSLSLLATPFLTGFYSKDLILELAYGTYSFSGIYAFILGSATAGLTAFYSFRLISLVFLTVPNGPINSYNNAHEANNSVILPLLILALFSIFFGYFTSDLFSGIGSDFFGNSIFIQPNNISLVEAEFSLPLWIKNLPFMLSLLGSSLALLLYHKGPIFLIDLTETSLGRKIYTFLNSKYYFDIIYNNYIISKGLNYGYNLSKWLDRGILECVGPHGISNSVNTTADSISKLDTGIITTYATYIVLGGLSLIFIIFGSVLPTTSSPEMLLDPRLIILIFLFLTFMPNVLGSSDFSNSTTNSPMHSLTFIIRNKHTQNNPTNINNSNILYNSFKKFKIYLILLIIICIILNGLGVYLYTYNTWSLTSIYSDGFQYHFYLLKSFSYLIGSSLILFILSLFFLALIKGKDLPLFFRIIFALRVLSLMIFYLVSYGALCGTIYATFIQLIFEDLGLFDLYQNAMTEISMQPSYVFDPLNPYSSTAPDSQMASSWEEYFTKRGLVQNDKFNPAFMKEYQKLTFDHLVLVNKVDQEVFQKSSETILSAQFAQEMRPDTPTSPKSHFGVWESRISKIKGYCDYKKIEHGIPSRYLSTNLNWPEIYRK